MGAGGPAGKLVASQGAWAGAMRVGFEGAGGIWVLEDLQASWWLRRERVLVPCGLVVLQQGSRSCGCWTTCRPAGPPPLRQLPASFWCSHCPNNDAHVQVVCGSMGMPTATVRMRGPDGISRVTSGIGSGPVDAAYKVGRLVGRAGCVNAGAHPSRPCACRPSACLCGGCPANTLHSSALTSTH